MGQTAKAFLATINQRLAGIEDAFIVTVEPPPVNGIGGAGGFKMMLEDRANVGTAVLEAATRDLVAAANADPRPKSGFTPLYPPPPNPHAHNARVKTPKPRGAPPPGV